MSKENNIDRLFREGLSSHTETPPTHVWDSINSQLGKERKRKRVLILWQGTAAAAIIGLIFLATLFFNHRNFNNQNTILTDQTKTIEETKKLYTSQESFNNQNHITLESNNKVIKETTNTQVTDKENVNTKNTLQEKHKSSFVQTPLVTNNNRYLSSRSETKTIASSENKLLNNKLDYLKLDNYNIELLPNEEINASFVFFVFNKDFETNQLTDFVFVDPDLEEKNKKELFSEISIGGKIAPSYSYRNSSNNYASNESGITSLTGGINLNLKTSKRLRIETGLMYAQVGQKFNNSSLVFENSMALGAANDFSESRSTNNSELQNSLGIIQKQSSSDMMYSDLPTTGIINEKTEFLSSLTSANSYEVDVQQELDYIEIPFILKYDIIQKNITISLNGGFSTNFLIGNNAYQLNNNSKSRIGSMENINSVAYSTSFGFGVKTPLSTAFNLNIEPRFKYFLNSITNATGYDYKPYSFGVLFGVNYKF